MKSEILKHFPTWMPLLVIGAILVLLGSATKVTYGKNSLEIASPFNIGVIVTGAVVMMVALWHSRRRGGEGGLPATKVEVRSIDIDRTDHSCRARVSGRIEPAIPGVRVWIVREHLAQSPGRFHPGHTPALTDKNGEWQQTTFLWSQGDFRIHAVVGDRAAESLFVYYRRAFDHARSVYKAKVDSNADSFPDWPFLEELPYGCVSDFRATKV